MKDVSIIELPPDRWREAKRLRLEALREEPSAFASSLDEEGAFSDELWRARLESARNRAGNLTYFAELEGELVGMAGASWPDRAKIRHVANVYGVYLRPALRGRGIAAALMRALLDELAAGTQIEKVGLTVNQDSPAAIRLYERLGFEVVGRAARDLKLDGRYYDLLYMELHLPR